MSISRYDPYGLSLRNAMDQLLTQSFVNPNWFGGQQSSVAPMNVYETNNGYEVQVSLPGVKAHDIDLTVQQNTLDIKGKFSYSGPMSQEGQQSQTQGQQAQSHQTQQPQTPQSQPQSQTQTKSQGQQSQQGQGHYNTLMQEMTSGSFERTITFPRAIDANKIQTNFDNGILTIWVPVSEASRPKKINVQSSVSGQSQSQSQPQHVSVHSSQS